MTTYITLFSLTDAGIKAAKDSPRRVDAAKKLLAGMGRRDEAVIHGDGRVRLCRNLRGEPSPGSNNSWTRGWSCGAGTP